MPSPSIRSWNRKMRQARILLCAVLILGIVPALSINSISGVYAETPYSLNPVPAFTQEGRAVSLVLTVNNAFGGTPYEFRFSVTDPAGRTVQSPLQNYTTSPSQNSFSILVVYPSTTFSVFMMRPPTYSTLFAYTTLFRSLTGRFLPSSRA